MIIITAQEASTRKAKLAAEKNKNFKIAETLNKIESLIDSSDVNTGVGSFDFTDELADGSINFEVIYEVNNRLLERGYTTILSESKGILFVFLGE